MRRFIIFMLFIFACYPQGNVGIVEIKGVIWDHEEKVKEINFFIEKKPDIKALVIYINSPGGSASASYQIFSIIKKFKEKIRKKVYAYISSIGASGGYYIACAADKIASDPNSLTGSIGVRASFIYYYDLLKKIGVYEKTLKTGKYKDIGSPFREMSKEEEKIIKDFLYDIYEQFVLIVSESRGIPEEKVRETPGIFSFSSKRANFTPTSALLNPCMGSIS